VRSHLSARTRRGGRVLLKANISTPGELALLENINHDGIGLLRTEFLFQGTRTPPTEEEQYRLYSSIARHAGGRPIVARLFDIGGDKLPPYITLAPEENTDLGMRGMRALPRFRDIYRAQVTALLRAAREGDIRILYPMVADTADLVEYRKFVASVRESLPGRIPRVKEGIMIETPSAALCADELLERVDFANIGSNDLLQYTLAAGRGNQAIEQRYHILHPAVVRLMEIAVSAGRRQRKEICLCGEAAGFEELLPLLIAIGLRSFSVAAAKVPDIKCELLHIKKRPRSYVERFYARRTRAGLNSFFSRN